MWVLRMVLYYVTAVKCFIMLIFRQDEMTNALALMRVDQVAPIKNLDTVNNKLLKKRQKRNKSVEGVK